MHVLAVCGVKNSGKTTLLTKITAQLTKEGIKIAVIKHDGHSFQADRPGTDSFRHKEAGAFGTAVFCSGRFSIVKDTEKPVTETELFSFFPEADLILLEGFKHSSYAKIEVVRRGSPGSRIQSRRSSGCGTDLPAARICGSLPPSVKQLDLNDISGICRFIRSFLEDPASERKP